MVWRRDMLKANAQYFLVFYKEDGQRISPGPTDTFNKLEKETKFLIVSNDLDVYNHVVCEISKRSTGTLSLQTVSKSSFVLTRNSFYSSDKEG